MEYPNLKWQGYLFSEVFEQLIQPVAQPDEKVVLVLLRGQDGYRCDDALRLAYRHCDAR